MNANTILSASAKSSLREGGYECAAKSRFLLPRFARRNDKDLLISLLAYRIIAAIAVTYLTKLIVNFNSLNSTCACSATPIFLE